MLPAVPELILDWHLAHRGPPDTLLSCISLGTPYYRRPTPFISQLYMYAAAAGQWLLVHASMLPLCGIQYVVGLRKELSVHVGF